MTEFPNLAGLGTLVDAQQKRRAVQKFQIPTRLDERVGDDRDEKAAEQKWRKACIKRDGRICQHCERKVVQQLRLAPERLEVHHIAGRADTAVRWDVRNGIVVCYECHSKLTRRLLHIVQVARHLFRVGQKTYINANKPIQWKEAA